MYGYLREEIACLGACACIHICALYECARTYLYARFAAPHLPDGDGEKGARHADEPPHAEKLPGRAERQERRRYIAHPEELRDKDWICETMISGGEDSNTDAISGS